VTGQIRQRWHCHPLQDDMPPAAVAGGVAIVIDVLRASTTIITALAEGAAFVLPTAQVAVARQFHLDLPAGTLLGGERGGVRIEGFDLGNSPAEYGRSCVAGHGIVLTTTNGTAALARCAAARVAFIGSLINRTAVATAALRLAGTVSDVHLVCAGTDGQVTEEDLLGAGAILAAVRAAGPTCEVQIDRCGEAALASFCQLTRAGCDATANLVKAFSQAPGGANLIELGMASDLSLAAAIDRFDLVPRLCERSGRLLADAKPSTSA
jgi:2-phosphosulfolactate phosphatase